MTDRTLVIGRIVLYHYGSEDSGNGRNGALVAPAVVSRVWPGDRVNLRVLCDGDVTLWKTSVDHGAQDPVRDHRGVVTRPSYWLWPDEYPRGVAQ